MIIDTEKVKTIHAADLLGVDPKTIRRWEKDGLERNKDKTCNLHILIPWRMKMIEELAEEANAGPASPARERKLEAEADIKEMDRDKRKGELIELADVVKRETIQARVFKETFVSLGREIAMSLVGKDAGEAEHIIRMECEKRLRGLAK